METEQYYNYFLPELKEQGYDGFFSPKSRARTMSESDRKHVDGCAIFYKTEKYDLHSLCVNEVIWTVVLLLLPARGGLESAWRFFVLFGFRGFRIVFFAEGWGRTGSYGYSIQGRVCS